MTSGKIRVKLKASMVQETELFQSQSYKYSNHINGTGSGHHPLQQHQRSSSQPSSARKLGQQPHQQHHLPGIRSASPNTFATPTNIAAAGELGLFTQSHGKTHVHITNSAGRTPLGANAAHNGSGNSLMSGMISSNYGGSLLLGANQALQSSGHFKMSGGAPGGQTPTVPLLAIPIQQNNTSGGHHFIQKHGDMPPAALNSGGLMSSSVLSGSNYNR